MKTIKYRDYQIVMRADGDCMIYDDEGEYLNFELSLNDAKDWVEAEQAGEHD